MAQIINKANFCEINTRSSYITNSLDNNERMGFVQKQIGHTTTKMIVEHYYNHISAPDDGNRLEKAFADTIAVDDLMGFWLFGF